MCDILVNWVWLWIILFIAIVGFLAKKSLPYVISDKSDCYNHCISFKKGECHLYGSGHIAKSPCPDYYKHKIIEYNPEEDNE